MYTVGVYRIRNKRNGKFYVGSSIEIEKRLERHRRELERGIHHCIYLQRAWNKYGADSFIFEVIHECSSEEEARLIEQQYLDNETENLYNISRKASGGDIISYHPNKQNIIQKMAQSIRKRYESMTPEERKKKHATYSMKGRRHTEEARRKMSEAQKGRKGPKGVKRTPEQRARLSQIASQRTGEKNPFYGKRHSEETKRKLSEKNKGKLPPNTKPVVIDGVVYVSITEAARQLSVVPATILNRIRSDKFPTYHYLET